MNPQEKAKELIDKFSMVKVDGMKLHLLAVAKECARICVQEIIDSYAQYTGMYDQEHFDAEKQYWQQVLTALNTNQ